jgi:hypothetical protein
MSSLLPPLFCLLAIALLLLVVMALLSPFEALGWWAGWTKRELKPVRPLIPVAKPSQPVNLFIVYLTAIGGISADISTRERRLLTRLRESMPGQVVIVDDVFPFSATNNPLNGERPFSWLWQRLHNSRLGGKAGGFAALIFIRNLFQVAVSGDPRYGPIYNVGVARALTRSLLVHGYIPDSGVPIAVMGWSGGAQIAVGVAPYLHEALQAPIIIVSIGGVMSDDPGIDQVEHLYHLQGSRDSFPRITELLYPGRWSFMRYSHWNRAEEAGKITRIDPGPMRHTGKDDYLDRHALLPNGQSHLDRTIEVITAVLNDQAVSDQSAQPLPASGD